MTQAEPGEPVGDDGVRPSAGVGLPPVGDDHRAELGVVAAAEAGGIERAHAGRERMDDDRRRVELARRIRCADAVGRVRVEVLERAPAVRRVGGRAVAAVLVVERADHDRATRAGEVRRERADDAGVGERAVLEHQQHVVVGGKAQQRGDRGAEVDGRERMARQLGAEVGGGLGDEIVRQHADANGPRGAWRAEAEGCDQHRGEGRRSMTKAMCLHGIADFAAQMAVTTISAMKFSCD